MEHSIIYRRLVFLGCHADAPTKETLLAITTRYLEDDMKKNEGLLIWLVRFHSEAKARFKQIRVALAKATPIVAACDVTYTRHSHKFSDPGQDYINLQSDRARIHRDREAFRVDMKSLSRDLRRWFIQHDAIMARTNARHTSKNHPSQLPPCE